MQLSDTLKLMISDDWRDQLKAEYWQLYIRLFKSKDELHYDSLLKSDQMPDWCRELLKEQKNQMEAYLNILAKRMKEYDSHTGNHLSEFVFNTNNMCNTWQKDSYCDNYDNF